MASIRLSSECLDGYLMLGWLASSTDVGIYRIVVSLAMICSLPIHAIITIFNPIIVELVNKHDYEKQMASKTSDEMASVQSSVPEFLFNPRWI